MIAMKNLKKLMFVLLIIIISVVIVVGFNICQKQNSNKNLTNINVNAIYYLNGEGDNWDFNNGVLIVDSKKCFFTNGILKNKSSEEIMLKTYNITIEEKNIKNEVVSHFFALSGEYTDESNIAPNKTIEMFESLTPKQGPIYYKDIKNNDLFLTFKYKDSHNEIHKEEIKLNKQLFSWN